MFGRIGELLFEDLGGGLLLGVGAVLVAPVALPVLRPVTKQIIKGGLLVADKVKEYTVETGEKWSDLVAEAKAEVNSEKSEATPIPVHTQ
ncbi:MAG: DUF5132 domain-containing protein [Caldilineaceae bacterium]